MCVRTRKSCSWGREPGLLLVVVACASALTCRSHAQSVGAEDLLAGPAAAHAMICRSPRAPDSTVAQEWWFEGSGDGGREIRAAFDTVGAPLRLTVVMLGRSGQSGRASARLAVSFGTGGDSGVRSIPVEESVVPLTLSELRRARALAGWLWAHRCRYRAPSPTQRFEISPNPQPQPRPRRS